MKFFDSHAHYFDSWFEEYEGGADALLGQIFSENVGYMINVGTNVENAKICIEQAKRYENMYCAVGIHPEDCLYYYDSQIEEKLSALEEMLKPEFRKENKIVALGEIGFDYHIENLTEGQKEKQKIFFERQMQLAEKYDLPVIIHDREAHGDCFEMALEHGNVNGVFHSYSGSAEMARELTRRGWYISFSGVVTFKNANRVREVLRSVQMEKLLIETDAPYLAPHPYRGKMNHSGLLSFTAEAFATELGMTVDEVAILTANNAKRLFEI